ncbi:MAG: PAS domain S-box protein [Chloroflexales bacterium]|nr:PAS domain S-box protein [Chloroflexales bacterium]
MESRPAHPTDAPEDQPFDAALLREIVAQAPEGILVATPSGHFSAANPAAGALLGYAPAALRDHTWQDLIHADIPSADPLGLADLPPGAIRRQEARLRLADGRTLPVLISTRRLADGRTLHLLHDLSARTQAEAQLHVSEAHFRALAEAAEDSIFLINPDETVAYVNPAGARFIDLTPEAIIGRRYAEFFPPASATQQRRRVQQVFATELPQSDEFVVPTAQGERWMRAVLAPLTTPDGAVAVVGTARDITAQKRAEAALRLSEARFRTVVTHAQPIIFMLDREGTFLLSEGKMLAALGLKPGEVVGQSAFVRYRDHPAILHGLRTALAGQHYEDTIEVHGASFDIFYTPYDDGAGAVAGVIGMAVDLTARVQAEAELRALNTSLELRVAARTAELAVTNQQLQELNAFKNTVLAMASHDLRSPLSVIQYLATQLQDEPGLPARAADLGKQIDRASQQMHDLLRKLLDLVRLETGQLELEPMPLLVSEVAHQVVAALGYAAEAKGLALALHVAPGEATIWADGLRLFQVLSNLLSNAVKFTHPGGQIRVEVAPEPAGMRLRVTDTGLGIPAEALPQLFAPFRQLHRRGTANEDGSGLGLAIARQLVELHGGVLEVASTVGDGSTFTVHLPLGMAAPRDADHPTDAA